MPNKKMQEAESLGPRSVLGLCSPLLLLAEVEAEGKAKAPRLRAQQRGRVAKGKKGRLKAILRRLWSKKRPFKAYIQGIEIGGPSGGPHNPSEIHRAAPARRSERSGQPGSPVPKMSPKEKAG